MPNDDTGNQSTRILDPTVLSAGASTLRGSTGSTHRLLESARPLVLADNQLIVLHEVAKSLAQDRSLQATLSLIADKARYLTGCASTALCLLDENREMLDFAAVAGRGAAEMVGQQVGVEDALPGETALTGEPLLAYNPGAVASLGKSGLPTASGVNPAAAFDEPFVLSGGVRSAAVAPIVIGSVSMGSLAAINRLDGESFTGSDLLMLQILASSASVAIQKDFLGRRSAQRERERNVLFRVAQNTAPSLDVQKILEGVLDTLMRSTDMFAAVIFLLNDERTHLYIAADYGLTEDEREVQILADGPMASAALANGGSAFIIADTERDKRYEDFLPNERAQVQTAMVVPLAARESPSGLMVVMSRQKDAYGNEDLALLAAVSAQTAIAIENAWLYEDATRRAEEATAIYELSQAVNTNLNLPRVLNFVADSILALLQVDKFALFLYNPDTQRLEIQVARNIRRETVQSMMPGPEQRGIAWWVYQYETPTAVQDVAADHRNRSCPIDQEGVASLVSVPLQAGDIVIGVIHAMSSRRRSFSVAEMELLYTIANQVGVAVSNIKILEDTRQKSAELRRSFRRIAKALGVSSDSAQTAQTIVDLAAEMMESERAVLYSSTGGGSGQLGIRAAKGMRLPSAALGAAIDPGTAKETSAGWIARRARSLAIDDPMQNPHFVPATLLAPYVSRCGFYLGVPLKMGKEVVGVLEVYSREARTLPAEEMRQFLTFASQAAVALKNSLIVEEADQRRRDMDAIARITATLHSSSPVDAKLVTSVLSTVLNTISADFAFIVSQKLGSKRKGVFTSRTTLSDTEESAVRDTMRDFAELGQPRSAVSIWPNIPLEPWPSKGESRPIVSVPLADQRPLGALCIARQPGRAAFDPNDLLLIKTVGLLIGLSL